MGHHGFDCLQVCINHSSVEALKIPTIKLKGNNTIDINDIHATETRLVSITATDVIYDRVAA